MHDFYVPDNMDPDKFTEDLLKKIEKYLKLLTPGTDEYEIAYMMKGYAAIQLVNWNKVRYPENDEQRLRDIQSLKQVLAMAEPIKMKKNGFMLYFDTLMTLSFHYRSIRALSTSRQTAKKMEKAYDAYCATNSAIPTHSSHIEGSNIFDQYQYHMMKYQICFIHWQSHHYYEFMCPVQYPAGAIKWMLHVNKEKYEGTNVKPHLFEPIYYMVRTLLDRHCFKQVDNVMANLMFFLIKCRRNMLPELLHTLNDDQGILARLFARWGAEILQASVDKIANKSYVMDNDTFLEVNEPGDVDYKIYTGQLPIEPVDNVEDAEKIYRKGLQWEKRAAELCTEACTIKDVDFTYRNLSHLFEKN